MSKEGFFDRLLKKRTTRRGFLRNVAIAAGVVSAPILGPLEAITTTATIAADIASKTHADAIFRIALSAPPAPLPEITEVKKYKIYQGSVEDNAIKAGTNKFIDPEDHGQIPLIKEVALHDPIVNYLTKRIFKDANGLIKQGKKILPGDLYYITYKRALRELAKEDPANIAPGTNLHLEAMHRTIYAVAAFGTPFFSYEEYQDFGVTIPKDIDPERLSWWWLEEGGFGRLVYPRFYGDKYAKELTDGEPFKHGEDRFMHVSNHVFLSFMYRYLNEINHPLGNAIPISIKLGLDAARQIGILKTDSEKASTFSWTLGWGYEIRSTIMPMENLIRSGRYLLSRVGVDNFTAQEGLLDPYRDEDIDANALAAGFGNELFEVGNNILDFRKRTKWLNRNRHKYLRRAA